MNEPYGDVYKSRDYIWGQYRIKPAQFMNVYFAVNVKVVKFWESTRITNVYYYVLCSYQIVCLYFYPLTDYYNNLMSCLHALAFYNVVHFKTILGFLRYLR